MLLRRLFREPSQPAVGNLHLTQAKVTIFPVEQKRKHFHFHFHFSVTEMSWPEQTLLLFLKSQENTLDVTTVSNAISDFSNKQTQES